MLDTTEQKDASAISKSNFVIAADDAESAEQILRLALELIGDEPGRDISLVGLKVAGPDSPIGESAAAVELLGSKLDEIVRAQPRVRSLGRPIMFHEFRQEVTGLIDDQDETLLLLPWRSEDRQLREEVAQVLRDPPCDVAVVRSPIAPERINRILLPVRGGPFALLSLQLALQMARSLNAEVTLLRVLPADDDAASRALREGFTALSDIFPEITSEVQVVGDPTTTILRMLRDHQAIVLGATADDKSPIGLIASIILHRKDLTTLIVKTREPFRLPPVRDVRSDLPRLVRLEKWLAEDTFRSGDFRDVGRLVDLKRKLGLSISLGLPTNNDQATISLIITAIKRSLVEDVPLVDEVVVLDNGSTDATRRIAAAMGVQSYASQNVLSGYGTMRGRGEALWKSLYLLKGDLILWMKTDVTNPDPGMITGILGPMLVDPRVQYVKGFYGARPECRDFEADSITELLLRPMISLLFPDLAAIISPLAGMHGGRRSALERIPFYSGYGVEVGILLEIVDRFGLQAIAQVDLFKVMRSRSGEQRSVAEKTAFSILQVFLRHLNQGRLIDSPFSVERTMKLLRREQERFHLEEIDVHEQERPPMLAVKEYRGRHLAAPVLNQ